MPNTPDPEAAAARKAAPEKDADELRMDKLRKSSSRLTDALIKQIARVEQTKNETNDAATRAADARTLASLQRTMERITSNEREYAAMKTSWTAKRNERLRKDIDAKFARIFGFPVGEAVP